MAIKHRIKFKGDQARGTSPAELRSSDENEYRSGGAYRAMLKLFRENLKNENNT